MYTISVINVYKGLIVLFLCGFFVYGPQSSFWALGPDLVGHKRAGTATGVMNFFAYLFAGLGEPLIGFFMDKHHDTSLVFLIVGAASAVVALFIRRQGTRQATDAVLAQASVVPWIVMEIGSREAVASGVGFGVVSSAEYIPDERLTFARAADAEIYNHALLCCMAERTTARLIAAFLTAATEGRNRAKG